MIGESVSKPVATNASEEKPQENAPRIEAGVTTYEYNNENAKKDIFLPRETPDTPLDVHWEDRGEGKPRAISMQSPVLLPRLILESPALAPHPPPCQQFEEGYSYMERRRSSIANDIQDIMCVRKGTEDGMDFNELRRNRPFRREAIIPLDPVKEEPEVDKDGFKRPRELRATDKEGGENQEAPRDPPRKESADTIGMMLPPHIVSPLLPMMQSGMLPPISQAIQPTMIHMEERKEETPEKENFRVMLPLNAATAFMPPSVFNSNLLQSAYSPDYMPCMPPQAFGYPAEYGMVRPAESVRKGSEYGFKMTDFVGEGLQPNYFCSPFLQPSPAFHQTPQHPIEQPMPLYGQQEEFHLDGGEPNPWKQQPTNLPTESKVAAENQPERKIGTLTVSERREKIQKYLEKRKRRIWKKKISYDCRKKVADKRLRIKGRFVTREQAYAILGTTAEDLANNELLRALITSNNNCSIVTSAQNMKIRNIQTLFMASEKNKEKEAQIPEPSNPVENVPAATEEDKSPDNRKLRVEILKENQRDQVVEIKIETILKKGEEDAAGQEKHEPGTTQQRSNGKLPRIIEPIFQFKRLKMHELTPSHSKYHKEVGAF